MIRKFELADGEKVSALIQNTLMISNSSDYDISTIRTLSKIFAPHILKALSARREIYVYEHGGSLYGTISLEDDRAYSFFVVPDRQGTGVGRALLRHIEKRARKTGQKCLNVASSLTAVDFYRRMGYTKIGEKEDDGYGRTITMTKVL